MYVCVLLESMCMYAYVVSLEKRESVCVLILFE